MNTKRAAWAVLNIALFLAIVAGGWWVVAHRQDIIDWWRLRSYNPPANIAQLATDDLMTQRGRDLFYASDPKVEERTPFNQDCNIAKEEGAVLGCYTHLNIYIFNVNDPRLPGVQQVTAAHEMLHAAYDRLDNATKNRIDQLITAQADTLKGDRDLQDVIALYNKNEPGQLTNELHSILGTEYSNLSPELESYYKQYFTNRAKVVGFAQGYKSVFTASKDEITNYQNQLTDLKKQIDANTANLEQQNEALNQENAQLDTLRRSDPVTYNQLVPDYNSKVYTFNSLARTTQALVNQYNSIVNKINSEAALETDLTHSLDSRYQPVPAQ